MNYDLADVTHIEFDKKLVFEPKIKLFIGSAVVEIINAKKMKNPFDVFVELQSTWIKAQLERKNNGMQILSE